MLKGSRKREDHIRIFTPLKSVGNDGCEKITLCYFAWLMLRRSVTVQGNVTILTYCSAVEVQLPCSRKASTEPSVLLQK